MTIAKEACKELTTNGFFIAEGLCDKETVAGIRAEINELLKGVPFGHNTFVGMRTKRLHSLFSQTRSLDRLATHHLVLDVIRKRLGEVLLGASVACQVLPGEKSQTFHYDDGIYPLADNFRDVKIGVMWAIDDFTSENGATIVIPKSHGCRSVYPENMKRVHVTMPSGSALIYVGSLWHGAGENRTTDSRLGIILQYIESWLRPQDSHLISVPIEIARTLDSELRALLGYSMREPFLGYVHGRDPSYLFASDDNEGVESDTSGCE